MLSGTRLVDARMMARYPTLGLDVFGGRAIAARTIALFPLTMTMLWYGVQRVRVYTPNDAMGCMQFGVRYSFLLCQCIYMMSTEYLGFFMLIVVVVGIVLFFSLKASGNASQKSGGWPIIRSKFSPKRKLVRVIGKTNGRPIKDINDIEELAMERARNKIIDYRADQIFPQYKDEMEAVNRVRVQKNDLEQIAKLKVDNVTDEQRAALDLQPKPALLSRLLGLKMPDVSKFDDEDFALIDEYIDNTAQNLHDFEKGEKQVQVDEVDAKLEKLREHHNKK